MLNTYVAAPLCATPPRPRASKPKSCFHRTQKTKMVRALRSLSTIPHVPIVISVKSYTRHKNTSCAAPHSLMGATLVCLLAKIQYLMLSSLAPQPSSICAELELVSCIAQSFSHSINTKPVGTACNDGNVVRFCACLFPCMFASQFL